VLHPPALTWAKCPIFQSLTRLNRCAAVAVVVLAATGAAEVVAHDDTYLRCKGTIAIFYERGLQSLENQVIFVHVLQDRINVSGNSLLAGWDIQICRKSTDEFYFDSQSCKEGGPVDLSRPRQYGTLNKVTGGLSLSNEAPSSRFTEGSFVCQRTEPVMK
jgi:hypothetical protein